MAAGTASGARPTHAEVDLGAIAHNLGRVRAHAPEAAVYGVVKADAYGHGIVPVARRLSEAGADGICVSLVEEGLRLRDAGLSLPILVLGGAFGSCHASVLSAGLTPVVHDLASVQAFAAAAGPAGVALHVKVDTGMSRLGVPPSALPAFLDGLATLPSVRVAGVMTHLASAEQDADFTALQLRRFSEALSAFRARGHAPTLIHAANSAGVYATGLGECNLVRPGLALYGVQPLPGCDPGLRAAMRVVTEIVSVRDLLPGAGVGYGQTFVADAPMRVATVPIGYGDGLLRAASNRGQMLVRGRPCSIVGRVSMDLTSLDVSAVPDAAVGDEVVLIGAQGDAVLDADALARACGTIAYEVLTQLTARLPRRYRG